MSAVCLGMYICVVGRLCGWTLQLTVVHFLRVPSMLYCVNPACMFVWINTWKSRNDASSFLCFWLVLIMRQWHWICCPFFYMPWWLEMTRASYRGTHGDTAHAHTRACVHTFRNKQASTHWHASWLHARTHVHTHTHTHTHTHFRNKRTSTHWHTNWLNVHTHTLQKQRGVYTLAHKLTERTYTHTHTSETKRRLHTGMQTDSTHARTHTHITLTCMPARAHTHLRARAHTLTHTHTYTLTRPETLHLVFATRVQLEVPLVLTSS